jgi:hypothetical protein
VLDGEAVILRADGIFDFNALHTGKHNEEVQLCTREFERPLNSRERSAPRPGTVLFELMDGHYPNPSFICEFLLAPTE